MDGSRVSGVGCRTNRFLTGPKIRKKFQREEKKHIPVGFVWSTAVLSNRVIFLPCARAHPTVLSFGLRITLISFISTEQTTSPWETTKITTSRLPMPEPPPPSLWKLVRSRREGKSTQEDSQCCCLMEGRHHHTQRPDTNVPVRQQAAPRTGFIIFFCLVARCRQ